MLTQRLRLLTASILLVSGVSMLFCSPTEPASHPEYKVYFKDPPTSGVVGPLVFFDFIVEQPQDLVDSVQWGYQDSVSTDPIKYQSVEVDPVSGFKRLVLQFSVPATKRIAVVASYKDNITRTAVHFYHATAQ